MTNGESDCTVQCRCGWKGKRSELVAFWICPKCSTVFELFPPHPATPAEQLKGTQDE